MGVYNNNKDGTRSTLANTLQVVDAPMEQFVSRSEFSVVTPNDVSADNKLVAENEVTKAVSTMPTASSSLVGTIVQYVGTTTANYTNGYFYKCVSDGAVTPTYSWVEVISGGSGGSKYSPSYSGKNVVHMGDSWVDSYNIAELAAEKVGYTVTNVGFNATAISAYSENNLVNKASKMSLIKLAHAIETSTWTEQDDAVIIQPMWTTKLAVLKTIDWSSVDVLILSYGTNDFGAQNPIGDVSALDEECVCGALKTAIGIFKALNADMEIIVTTPCYRVMNYINDFERTMFDEYRNVIGLTAKECGVKLVDMRAISGINKENATTTLLNDGLHPTEQGQEMWAEAFAKSLECGYASAFDTSNDFQFGIDNLCFDSENLTKHKQWNAVKVVEGKKYLCPANPAPYSTVVFGITHFDSIPTGTEIKLKGIGRKGGTNNQIIGFKIYASDKSTSLLTKTDYVIKSTNEAPFEYSFTTETDYTDCYVYFYGQRTGDVTINDILVRNMVCTVQPSNGGSYVTQEEFNQYASENQLSSLDGYTNIDKTIYSVDSSRITYGNGYVNYDGTIKTSSNFRYAEMTVLEGETIRLTGITGGNVKLYALIDANDSVISLYPSQTPTANTLEIIDITIPTGVVKLRVSSVKNLNPEIYVVSTEEHKTIQDYQVKDIGGVVKSNNFVEDTITLNLTHGEPTYDGTTVSLRNNINVWGTTITVSSNEKYHIRGTAYLYTVVYIVFDSAHNVLSYSNLSDDYASKITIDTIVTIPNNGAYVYVASYGSYPIVSKVSDIPSYETGNVLYNKKWAVCGDSFTEGNFEGYVDPEGHTGEESDAYDPIMGMYKTYPWWITKRNNMNILMLAKGGNDFTNISGALRPFSNPNTDAYNYTQIPNDCDYVTLMFGLNETQLTTEQIGTKTDNTNETLWGAYNIVLESILTANPSVKIGIIISDAWMTQTYHDALIDIAKYWGIPYLDLKNGELVPMGIAGRLSECSTVATTLRNSAFQVTSTNSHPSVIGHKYRSTIIENFLRSL